MNLFEKLFSLLKEESFSPYMEASVKFLETRSLKEILPYLGFDPTTNLFQNKKSTGFILETVPLVGAGDEIQQQLEGLIQHTLPLGSSLQVLLLASPRIHGVLDHWKEPRLLQSHMLQMIAQERVDFLNKADLSLRSFRVILSYSEPFPHKTALQVLKQIKTTFEGFGLPVKELEPQDLIHLVETLFWIKDPLISKKPWDETSPISHQMFSPNFHLRVKKGELEGDHQTIRTYSVKRFPNEWYLGAMGNLIGNLFNNHLQIPAPFFIHYGVHIVSDKTLRPKIEAKTANLERLSQNPTLMKWVPSLRREVEDGQFLRRMLEEGQRAVKTRFQVGLLGETSIESSLDEAEQALINLFRSELWELERDQFIVLPSLLSVLPMTWGEGMFETNQAFKTTKTTLSHEPSNLLPIQGEWTGTKSPGLLLVGRRGQVFTWSPFDNDAGNYNTIVVGRSGSGKSVFMQELMTATLGQGGRVFVLDVGRSFEKTAKLLGGSYIEFSTKSNLCINPFSKIPVDAGKDTEDALSMLRPLVSLMAAPISGTTDLENSYIAQGIAWAWEKNKRKASITDIAEFLLKHEDKISRDLGHKIYPYTKDGIYGRFFNGKANVDLTSSLTVLELEELKERKDLQAVVVQVVILEITNQLYMGDRKTKSNLVLDEAWDLLRAKQAGEFIETAARRLRKYNGSLVVGTQSVNDFYQTPGAQAAFDNSDWMCLLSQKKESIDFLEKTNRLSLEPFMKELLKSVHTKQGQYAEVMIVGPHGYGIGRLFLDPFSKILYSTKAEEFERVQFYQTQGLSLEESVRRVAYGGPQGRGQKEDKSKNLFSNTSDSHRTRRGGAVL